MKLLSLLVVIGALMAAVGPGSTKSSAADRDRLQGTWRTVSLVNDGKTLVGENAPATDGPAIKLVYRADRWLIRVGDQTVAGGKFTLDPAKKPKTIDILDESGAHNEKAKLGIYG